MNFDEKNRADKYDDRVKSLIPGYDAFHEVTAAKLMRKFPEKGHFLIVGVGTGSELVTFANANPNWTFVVQDISKDMLEICKEKCEEAGILDRVTFNEHDIVDKELEGMKFDAITCLFVLHFIKTLEKKTEFLKMLSGLLNPMGSLYLADMMLPEIDDIYQRNEMAEYCIMKGLPREMYYDFIKGLNTRFDVLGYHDYIDLVRRSGFELKNSYFKALGFQAFDCTLNE